MVCVSWNCSKDSGAMRTTRSDGRSQTAVHILENYRLSFLKIILVETYLHKKIASKINKLLKRNENKLAC